MHCISVWIVPQDFIREVKLESILGDPIFNEIKWTQLKGCWATTDDLTPHLKDINKALWVETDYFGGAGEQSATLYEFGKPTTYEDYQYPIDRGLSHLGIVRIDNLDEFDTIGLGNYRTNEDFNS
jgi:hypothetical protein